MNLQLTLLIAYSVALVAIGLFIARFVKGSADFFVAGRSLTAPLLFATVLASNIGAGADVRRQHRSEEQRRGQRTAGDEEVRAPFDEARDEETNRDERNGVGDEEGELEIHERAG